MADVVEIECTVSTHPGIECSASEHGVITIRTKTGSITIRLQQTFNKRRVPIRSVEQQPVRTVESSSRSSTRPTIFLFAGNSGQEHTREDDGSNTGGSNNSLSGKEKSEEPLSDEKLAELYQQLASGILEKWKSKKQRVAKSLEALRIDWPDLFGCPRYTSNGQWSYKALDKSEKYEGLQRRFHQLNLAYWWNESKTTLV